MAVFVVIREWLNSLSCCCSSFTKWFTAGIQRWIPVELAGAPASRSWTV